VPIAAPSANLFSHVSPTSPIHVFNDFYNQEICIIDGEKSEFGIESTVIKLIQEENNKFSILMFRQGSLSEKSLRECLDKHPIYKGTEIKIVKKPIPEKKKLTEEKFEAPGQSIKHYSPYIETYLLRVTEKKEEENIKALGISLNDTILIDFAGYAKNLQKEVLYYISLSEKGDLREAMNKLYDLLRWAENISGCKTILISNVEEYFKKEKKSKEELPEFLETIYDKMFRSSAGKIACIQLF